MSFTVSVPDVQIANLLMLIKDYAICNCDVKISRDPQNRIVEFYSTEGKRLTGGIAAARYVASLGTRSVQLLGNTIEERSKIAEIVSLTRFISMGVLDSQLEVFDRWLKSRTFIVGNMVTIADLILYANLSSAIITLPCAQHMHFCNILRWYENIHFIADSGGIFPRVAFNKPKFNYVPPLMKPSPQANNEKKEIESGVGNSKIQVKESTINGAPDKQHEEGKSSENVSKNTKPPKKEKGSPKEDPTFDFLDVRVGLIKSIGPHPNADALYVEEIDLGEEKPRTVVSGLRKFVSEEEMMGRKVAVVCNLKPAKMRDVMSFGMVLCASNADHSKVDPILVPKESTIGSRIRCEGFNRDPEAQINPKKKIFEKIAPELLTDKGTFPME